MQKEKKWEMEKSGYLELFLGPMFSSKTSHLIMIATEESDTGSKVLYINHSGDIRETKGGELGKFTSHSSSLNSMSKDIATVCTKVLGDVRVDEYDVIAVDEGNFYRDIFTTVVDWVNRLKKTVYIAALDGDSNMGLFGDVYKLYPFADKYTKLNGKCLACRDEHLKSGCSGQTPKIPAPFSKRIVNDTNQELVGGVDKFVAVCRYHHSTHNY